VIIKQSNKHFHSAFQHFKLTQQSLARFKQGIPLSILPQAFQDATYVVRYLGQQYLWIDALCIIQDDPLDWREQAAKMADVYLNSELNIAVSESKNSHDGIFWSRNPLEITPCIIQTRRDGVAMKIIASVGAVFLPATVISVRPISRKVYQYLQA
jgi:hypothetical protein